MKKFKCVILSIFIGLMGSGLFAQGYPVLDIANLSYAIEGVYQYYQQIQATIEQVQNTYTQIEQSAKQMASANWNDLKNLGSNFNGLSAENPFEVITSVRNSAQDITKAVEKNMNKVNELQESLTKKSISFGGMDVSIADLCGAGDDQSKNLFGFVKNAWNHTTESLQDAVKGYTGKLTYAQKEEIMKKYGMSPKNYATLEMANYQLSELMKDANLLATEEGNKKLLLECENDANALNSLAKNLPESSEYAQVQLINSNLAQAQRLMGNLQHSLNRGFGIVSNYISSKKTEDAIKQQAEQEENEKNQEKLKNSSVENVPGM